MIIAVGVVVSYSLAAQGDPFSGPMFSARSAAGGTSGLYKRPIIGLTLPPLPVLMQTQQGSGPDPDYNLTITGSATQEL